MKKAASVLILILFFAIGYGQHMVVKKPNLVAFPWAKKKVSAVLDTMSSAAAKKHPEYGYLPFNAQCSECVELIDKRTMTTRFYVDPYVPTHTFSQTSFFPLHYKNYPGDIWRTIDPRLEPDTLNPGVYTANRQPLPTKCDLNKKSTSISIGNFEFEFNKNLTLFYSDDDVNANTKAQEGNYSNYTIGQQGLAVQDIWPGIDMQQVFAGGEVKASYTIKHPLQIPVDKGYMVIEDHFTLPEGYTFEESNFGERLPNGGFRGNYNLKDKKGNTLLIYTRAVYIDFDAVGLHGYYKLIKNGNDYSLQMLVPVKWLNRPENHFPLTIDPMVQPGDSAWGNFISSGAPGADLGFTTVALGRCDYHMSVSVPGKSQLTNTLINIEYQLTYSDSCGSPPEPAPYCLFSQVNQYVTSDLCNFPIDFRCNNIGDTTGYCTTDSFTDYRGFHNFDPASFSAAEVLPCYAPQCPNYDIPFTLGNTDSICGDVCGYLCARGSKWEITIEACQVNGTASPALQQVCAGQTATFTAQGNCGVPPYHYIWSPDGGNTFDTIYGSPDYVIRTSDTITSPVSIYIVSYVIDSCQVLSAGAQCQLNIIPSPRADAGPDKNMCRGGQTVTIGGNPTTNNGATTTWTGSDPTVQGWLNSTTIANPTVTVPAGTVDTFFYVLTTNDVTCPNTDTVNIYSSAGEQVKIDSEGVTRICAGDNVKLTTLGGPFSSYIWSNGFADSTVTATGGPYYVIVKDSLGCMDTSNIITVTTFGPPSVNVYPDTTIMQGDSVLLYSDVNLGLPSIDSFEWSPSVHISCLNCPYPYVAPLADQQYTLAVYSEGCVISASAFIQVILPDNFFIPNVFTPNGDGFNDQFYIEFQSGVTVLQFQVFDRWGEKVHDGLYPWDGSYRGKPAPDAVYVYVFKLQLSGHDLAVMRKGSVTLLR